MSLLIFLISCLCSLFSGVIWHDIHYIKTRRLRIRSGKIRKEIRFAVISDLHGRKYGEDNRELIERIRKEQPDAVLMVGDIMTAKDLGYSIPGSVDTAETLIRELAKDVPVYFAIGNHEARVRWRPDKFSFTYRDMLQRFRKAGAVVLSNESTILEEYGIRLSGLDLPEFFYNGRNRILPPEYISAKVGARRKDLYNILLAHNPAHIPVYARWGADLSFSGHYHGGIMEIPGLGGVINPRLQIFPRFTGGVYRECGHTQIVCRGIGEHTFPIRVFNPVELLIVELKKA